MGLPHEDLAALQEKQDGLHFAVSQNQAKGTNQTLQLKAEVAELRQSLAEEVATRSKSHEGLQRVVTVDMFGRLNQMEQRLHVLEVHANAVDTRLKTLERKLSMPPSPAGP